MWPSQKKGTSKQRTSYPMVTSCGTFSRDFSIRL